MQRTAFFISDGTGITANALGRSLLAQFKALEVNRITLPYVDSPAKAEAAVAQINRAGDAEGVRPLVFFTIADAGVRQVLGLCEGLKIDVFSTYMDRLEEELGTRGANAAVKGRASLESDLYRERVGAVNFALANDDGAHSRGYTRADIILTGVSRTGKTPTCLYLALQFGIRAANYPLTPDDLDETQLPRSLRPYRDKVYGLSIEPELLSAIRHERRPDSAYASLRQCQRELANAEAMFRLGRIPFLDTSQLSVEEISTRIIAEAGLTRRFK